jgi:hypothetical protein
MPSEIECVRGRQGSFFDSRASSLILDAFPRVRGKQLPLQAGREGNIFARRWSNGGLGDAAAAAFMPASLGLTFARRSSDRQVLAQLGL